MRIFKSLLLCCMIFGCSSKEDTTCDNYCLMKTEAAIQDAENKLCSVYPSSLEEFEDKCLQSCSEVLTYMVDKKEQKGASDCLECLYTTTVEPSHQNINIAREECFEECNNLGGYQFFFSFFISEPEWKCPSTL